MPASAMICPQCGTKTPPGEKLCPQCSAHGDFHASLDATSGPVAPEPQPSSLRLTAGAAFGGRYTIVEAIGSGGMGQVYKAIDRQTERTVALKLIRPDLLARGDIVARFHQEVALAQQVTHANVCRLHDIGEASSIPYISMAYVEGHSLSALIRSVGRLSPPQTVSFARQICAGLAAVHERGIVHRDLKPSNIMIDKDGHAVIMDFGVARGPGPSQLTSTGMIPGTMLYASPEQVRGAAADARSDIYACGLILYEMLTGLHAPGDGSSLPLALRDRSERCAPPSHHVPEVPRSLDAIVMRCLEREPEKRFASVTELADKLAPLGDTTTQRPAPTGMLSTAILKPVRATWRRWPWLAGISVAAGLVVGGFVLSRFVPGSRTPGAGPEKVSVAMLPLAFEGPQDMAYLRHLVPVVLGEKLRGVRGLDVAPYASSRSFEADEDPGSVARALSVGFVLKGRLRVEETRATVDLALVPAKAREPSWQHKIEGDVGDLADRATAAAAPLAHGLDVSLDTKGVRVVDKQAMEHYLRGRAFLDAWDEPRNLARAEGELHQAIAHDPQFADPLALLASVLGTRYQETKEPSLIDEAQASAVRAVETDSALTEAHLVLGVLHLARGSTAAALQAFERAQGLAPADDAVCRRIAQAYALLGREVEAESMFQRAIDLRPAFWQNHSSFGSYALRRGRIDVAIRLFEKASDLRPSSARAWDNLGAAQLLGGHPDKAVSCFSAALEIQPLGATRSNLGAALYLAGRYEDALTHVRAAAELEPDRPEPLVNLADTLRQLGRHAAAAELYTRAAVIAKRQLVVNAEDTQSRLALILASAGRGRCREVQTLVAGTEAVDREPFLAYNVATALALCGQVAEARQMAEAAARHGLEGYVRTNPDLAPLWTSRASAHRQR